MSNYNFTVQIQNNRSKFFLYFYSITNSEIIASF